MTTRPRTGIHTGGEAWTHIHGQIAAAALAEIARTGWNAFTIEGVAAAAGVNKRTVYRHFDDRLGLALAGIRQLPTWAGTRVGDVGPRERVRHLVALAQTYPLNYLPVLATALTHREDTPELLATLTEHVVVARIAAMDAMLAEGVQGGWAKPTIAGWQVEALLTGLQVAQLRGDPHLSERKRTAAITDTVWEFIAVGD